MPPKSKVIRKRTSDGQTSSTSNKKQKSDTVPVSNIDYTKLASEIIRLQGLNANKTDVTSDSPQSVSVNPDVCHDLTSMQETPSTATVISSEETPGPSTESSANPTSHDQTKEAAMPVVSLIDKIFSGEVTKTTESIAFRPSDGIPLGAVVPLKIKSKIWNNEFIDLRLLLPNQKEDPLSVSIVPGTITLQQTSKKVPLSLNQWTTCFHIYMAIYIEKKLEEASHLLKYCEFIRDLNYDHGDSAWRYYDESFRRLRETHNAPWNIPVEELRGKAIGLNIKSKLNSTLPSGQTKPKHLPFRSREKTCFTFNRGEFCAGNCSYKHACAFCKSGSHNKLNCPKLQARPAGNQSSHSPSSQPKPTPNPNKGGNPGSVPKKL